MIESLWGHYMTFGSIGQRTTWRHIVTAFLPPPPGAPKPHKRFTWNLASLITSTIRPDTWPSKMQGGVGIRMKLHPRVLSLHFLLVTSMRSQLILRSVDFRSMHPKTCFGGECVPLGSVCPRGSNLPFYLKKHFFNGLKLRLCITWYRACAMQILTTNKDFGNPSISLGWFKLEISYLVGIFIKTSSLFAIGWQITH